MPASTASTRRLPLGSSCPSLPDSLIVFSLLTQGDTPICRNWARLIPQRRRPTFTAVPNFPPTIVYDLADTGQRIVAATENGLWAGRGRRLAAADRQRHTL